MKNKIQSTMLAVVMLIGFGATQNSYGLDGCFDLCETDPKYWEVFVAQQNL